VCRRVILRSWTSVLRSSLKFGKSSAEFGWLYLSDLFRPEGYDRPFDRERFGYLCASTPDYGRF
jgi:hypothetical protein